MEKVIYALQCEAVPDPAALQARLAQTDARSLRINLRDAAVATGQAQVQNSSGALPDAVVQMWLPNANPANLGAIDRVMQEFGCEARRWLVSEATILANRDHPAARGQRTPGFAQLALLTLPAGMAWAQWRQIWRDSHTQVAIATQATFEYVQNLVVEPLPGTDATVVAIVEECFPMAALGDALAFFDAAGDPARFKANLARMLASCARFITPGSIDVFPTSQYDFAD